jgi:cytochrome c2
MAPTLSNLNHKKIASDTFGRYSSALKSAGGEWDRSTLLRFLSDPGRFAPGTVMPKVDISSDEAQSIVDQLLGPDEGSSGSRIPR